MTNFKFVKLSQPIGDLYLGSMAVSDILDISFSNTRTPYNSRGIQRKLDGSRVKSIAEYAKKPDAIFPTPIVLSASSEMMNFSNENDSFSINKNYDFLCSVVDGQHRLEGIKAAKLENQFYLPVVFIFDTYLEQDAEIFATINGNQKPVSKSLVYDLYGLSTKRTVQKVCNTIIRSLNSEEDSLLEGKIKMLGIKDETNPNATVSQATMIDSLIKLITNNTERDNNAILYGNKLVELNKQQFIFREWFIQEKDYMILKVLRNYFNGLVEARMEVYGDVEPKYFSKSIGYMASFYLFRTIYWKGIIEEKVATQEYYKKILSSILTNFRDSDDSNKTYGSSESGAKQLFRDLLAAGLESGSLGEKDLSESDLKAMNLKN